MEIQRIRDLRLASPFRPFYVITQDGRRLLVEQSHHLGLAPDGSRLGVVTRTGVSLLKPEEVRDLDVLPAPLKARQ
jgi:hypothetical protein